MPDRKRLYWALGVFAVALLVRLIGIGWGLPNDQRNHSLHPDEPIILGSSQQIEPAAGDFTPGFYNYGTLYLTITRVATDIVSAYTGATLDEPLFLVANEDVRQEAGITSAESGEIDGILERMVDGVGASQSVGEQQAHLRLARVNVRELIGPEKWRVVEQISASNFRTLYLAGRVISALAGAGTALFVFLILYGRVNLLGSSFGAAVMAFAPGHVVHSRFQTVDVLATFFLVVSLWFALRISKPDEGDGASDKLYMKLAVWAGVFAGLSAGTKYTGILALVALVAVVLLDSRAIRWKALAFGVGAALLAFFITTPGALLESAKFMADFKYEMTHTQTGHGLVFAGTGSGFIFHIENLFVAFGLFATLLGAVGLLRASYRRHAWAIALLAFALVYYILIGRAEVKFMRYVFPLIPVLAVGFGWMMSRAHISPKPRVRILVMIGGFLGVGGLGGGVTGLLGGGLSSTVLMTSWMVLPDLRDVVAEQIKEAVKPGETVGFVSDPWFYSPPLYPNSGAMRSVPFSVRHGEMLEARGPSLLRYVPDNPAERFDRDKRLLTELEPDYVVWSSFEWVDIDRIMKLPSPPAEYETQIEQTGEFMDTLRTWYWLWKVHGDLGPLLPHDLAYIRPSIEVWKKNTDSASPSSGTSTTSEQSEGPASTQ